MPTSSGWVRRPAVTWGLSSDSGRWLGVLCAIGGLGGHRTRDPLLGSGQPQLFLTYSGIGLAGARLPRPQRKKVVPDPSGSSHRRRAARDHAGPGRRLP